MTETTASLRPPPARADLPAAGIRARGRWLVALAVVCINAWLLVHFHDRFWWPADEGNYAHVAERILDGEVMHADVQDLHPGYVNFANAAALGLFGRKLTSMRYPLVILGIGQSLLLFLILRRAGASAAAVAATTITALGFLQFLNPTANWYCLFLVILLAAVLHDAPRTSRWRLDAIGAIVMTIVLFRQLSGVLVAVGVLTWLLLERPDASSTEAGEGGAMEAAGSRPWLARALIAIMIAGLGAYLAGNSDALGWLLFGIWPMLVLVLAVCCTRASDARVASTLMRLARGASLAALPLVAYHVAHGSLGAWFDDTVLTAMRLPRMPFFEMASYGRVFEAAVQSLLSGSLRELINGAYWILLLFISAVAGVAMLVSLRSGTVSQLRGTPPALPMLAVFYGVVSVHYQVPIYLAYTVGLSFAAVVWLSRGSRLVTAAGAVMIAIAVVFHAGQPLSRGIDGTAEGRRIALVPAEGLPRVGLRVEHSDVELYSALLELIEREVPPNGSILAVPGQAELYFLSGRRNDFPFFNTAMGVAGDSGLAEIVSRLERRPPVLVFHAPRDKYNTPASRAIMEHVRATYDLLPRIGPFEIYRRRESGDVAARGPVQSSMR